MVKKGKRPSLSDLENGRLKSASSIAKSNISHSVISGNKIIPKQTKNNKKGILELNRTPYDELKNASDGVPNSNNKDSNNTLPEKINFYLASSKFQKCITRLIEKKWFRWCHLGIELVYFTLVLIYLFLVLEIENNNSYSILIIMIVVLFFCFLIYMLNLIDHWKDFKMI